MKGLRCVWSSLLMADALTLPFEGRAKRHVEQCVRCQAEAVSYRTLQHTLRTLRSNQPAVDPSEVEQVLARLQPMASVHRIRRRDRRRALLGGFVAATTAAGAGGMVWFARFWNRTSWAG